ncbi:MAG TPA: response regulator [Verrucomicrobiae bacterium]|jgi:PAS domain S-box-containing protein|nr:response regulator [Verrucomicrobiae bacterium]
MSDHSKGSSPDAKTSSRSRLLLVDDKPENLIALEAVLASDYDLVFANSGRQALELLSTTEVDVILLDIQMPVLDGYETARRIKLIERCRNTPIIFITAIYTENPHVKKGYEAGALDFFTKPFDPDILKMKIAVYASFRQKHALLKEREMRIRESEELLKAGRKLAAVLESLPMGVIIADVDGRVLQTNEAVSKIWKSTEVLEKDAYGDFLKWWESGGQVIKQAFDQALTKGAATHNQILLIQCFDGSAKTILTSVSPLRRLDEKIVGAVAVIQDITQHKKIEEDMEQRILKLISLGVEFEHAT